MQAVFSIANGPLISYLPYYGASASPGSCDTVDMLENMSRADRESRARAWRERVRELYCLRHKYSDTFPLSQKTSFEVSGGSILYWLFCDRYVPDE